MSRLTTSFPLMLLIVIVYNVVALGGGVFGGPNTPVEGGDPVFTVEQLLATPLLHVPMPSGTEWAFSYGDVFVVLALLFLFVEVVRSTGTGSITTMNHAFSLVVLLICVIEFVVVKGFATSTFFFITIMTFIDVAAGFIISIKSAQRDFAVGG